MTQAENSSSTYQALITRAKAISLGMGIYGPLADFGAKVAQTLGLGFGKDISSGDRAAIEQFYTTRAELKKIVDLGAASNDSTIPKEEPKKAA